MERSEYRFSFNDDISMSAVEEALLMAVIAAEGVHGRARVWLDARFATIPGERTCLISSYSEVGQSLAQSFSEYLILDFGETAFKVERNTSEEQER